MARLFAFTLPKVTTTTYSSSQTITLPPQITKINLTARGGSGTPATPGSYGTPVNKSAFVTKVEYIAGYLASNAVPGTLRWEDMQQNGISAVNTLNSTGHVNYTYVKNTQYDNGYVQAGTGYMTSGSVIPGSAYTFTDGNWKTSGPVSLNDYAMQYLAWQEYGPWNPGTPATTGGDTIAFGITFPGGVGGDATPATYNDLLVTPGQSYPLTIPSGGYVTVSYTMY